MRSCPDCAGKDEELRILRRELGVRKRDGEIGALMIRFGLTATQAKILHALYRGNGRCVAREVLADEMPLDGDQSALTKHVSDIRGALGEGSISTQKGLGYSLPVPTFSRVMAVLEPPELQDSRG